MQKNHQKEQEVASTFL